MRAFVFQGQSVAHLHHHNIDILIEPVNEYSTYLMVEIWIRPTITYGLVACYVNEAETA